MKDRILISEPNKDWRERISEFATGEQFDIDFAIDGKDAQLKIYNNKYYAMLLDINTINNSAFEVIRYVKTNRPSLKMILSVDGPQTLTQLDLKITDINKLGIYDVLVKPYTKIQLLNIFNDAIQYDLLKQPKSKVTSSTEVNVVAADRDFTRIKINEFMCGNVSVFDLYIRIKENNYLKILFKNDYFDDKRIQAYVAKGVEYLYFKTSDRIIYIKFINQMLDKLNKLKTSNVKSKTMLIKNLSEKYVEEIYTQGLKPQVIEQGKTLCDNVYNLLTSESKIETILKDLEADEGNLHAHSFLVAFFSAAIISKLEWGSKHTSDIVVMGSILHDIGKLKLPKEIRAIEPSKMNPLELAEYKKHPAIGVEMLADTKMISTQVKQIIHEHHETKNGDGFPQGITNIKTYPLAKVVALADQFVGVMTYKKINAKDALKIILKDEKFLNSHDIPILKAFLNTFIPESADIKLE